MSANEVCKVKFEVLSGLPPYGEMALPFPPNGYSSFREGFVVKFECDNGVSWTGNFQRGHTGFDHLLSHPDGKQVIIIAGGEGYIIDPEKRSMTYRFGGHVSFLELVPSLEMVVIGDFIGFHGFRADGTTWSSTRISWDGIRNISLNGTELSGEGYSPLDDSWHPFTLDLLTGKCANSIYEEQIAKFIPITRKPE